MDIQNNDNNLEENQNINNENTQNKMVNNPLSFTFKDGKLETKEYFTPKYEIDDTKSAEYWGNLIDETFTSKIS